MVGVIVLVGLFVGLTLGRRLGIGMTQLYVEFYRFPFLEYELQPAVMTAAALLCAGAALLGTLYSVRKAALSPPAEAMRPEPPAKYRETVIERLGLKRWLSQPTRMIARNIERRPIKSLLSVIGVAFAYAILMVGTSFEDAINFMVKVQFGLSQREDLALTFVEPTSQRALYELESLEGVQYGEVFRAVPVRLRFQHRRYLTVIQGVELEGDLYRLLDTDLNRVRVPPTGLLLTDYLAGILGVKTGDLVSVEVLEGSRPRRQVPVAGVVSQYVGVSGYMEREALNRLMREGRAISGAFLAVDSQYQPQIYKAIKAMPQVAGTAARVKAVKNFYETMGDFLLTFAFFATLFASTIAVGVVYNTARIALAERGRELASLRVLGYTRGEISYILLGELAVLTLAALPVGAILGYALCSYIVTQMETDLFRVPLVLEPSTYAFAGLVILAAALASGLMVRRRLDHLDLVAVLKTKE
jgi:putative ABC transport system permease protein